MAEKLKVTLVKSTIGAIPKHRATVEALGLKKLNKTVELPDNDAVRGMVWHVRHLVKVEVPAVYDPLKLLKDRFPVQPPQGVVETDQVGVNVVVDHLTGRGVEAHVAPPAEQVHKGIGVPREQREQLGEQPELAAGIVEGRGNHPLPLPVVTDAQKQPLGVVLNVGLARTEGLICLGKHLYFPPGAQDVQNILIAELGVGAVVALGGHVVVGKQDVAGVEVGHQGLEGGGGIPGAVAALEGLPVHLPGYAEYLRLLPAGHVLQQVVGVAVLPGVVGGVYVYQIGRDPLYQVVGVLVKTLVGGVVVHRGEGHPQLQGLVRPGAPAVGVVVAAGEGDLVHGVQQRGDQNGLLPPVQLPLMEAAFDVLPDIADFGAVGPAEIGVGKVFRHVVLLVHPEGVVVDDGLLNLAPVIGVRAKPGEIADIVAEHYVVGDETAVREGGGHSSGSGEQVGHDLNVLALPPGHLGDEGQQLIFVAQITAVVDKGGFVWRGLCCHSLPPPCLSWLLFRYTTNAVP